MLIACKFEEIYAPETSDFSKITDNTYTVQQIVQMEGKILIALNFDITVTSPLRFLLRYREKFEISD